MTFYLDSSALVKLYTGESGALDTIDLIDGADMVATSPITRVEITSALTRAVRTGGMTARMARDAYDELQDHWRSLVQVPLTERVLGRAQDLLWQSVLRAGDALQLASALVWQEQVMDAVTLATFDARLAAAARQARLNVWPA